MQNGIRVLLPNRAPRNPLSRIPEFIRLRQRSSGTKTQSRGDLVLGTRANLAHCTLLIRKDTGYLTMPEGFAELSHPNLTCSPSDIRSNRTILPENKGYVWPMASAMESDTRNRGTSVPKK